MVDSDDEQRLVHDQPKLPPCLPGYVRFTPINEPTRTVNTTIVRAAARRPRHPTVRRDSIRAAYRIQITSDHDSTGSHDQKWPQVASAQIAPVIIARLSIAKPHPSN